MAFNKKYSNELVAGAAIRDDKGEVISKKYATKSSLDDKVDKVKGKGLSTNDFTNELKNKLENLNEQVNTDWEESDETSKAFLLNKPFWEKIEPEEFIVDKSNYDETQGIYRKEEKPGFIIGSKATLTFKDSNGNTIIEFDDAEIVDVSSLIGMPDGTVPAIVYQTEIGEDYYSIIGYIGVDIDPNGDTVLGDVSILDVSVPETLETNFYSLTIKSISDIIKKIDGKFISTTNEYKESNELPINSIGVVDAIDKLTTDTYVETSHDPISGIGIKDAFDKNKPIKIVNVTKSGNNYSADCAGLEISELMSQNILVMLKYQEEYYSNPMYFMPMYMPYASYSSGKPRFIYIKDEAGTSGYWSTLDIIQIEIERNDSTENNVTFTQNTRRFKNGYATRFDSDDYVTGNHVVSYLNDKNTMTSVHYITGENLNLWDNTFSPYQGIYVINGSIYLNDGTNVENKLYSGGILLLYDNSYMYIPKNDINSQDTPIIGVNMYKSRGEPAKYGKSLALDTNVVHSNGEEIVFGEKRFAEIPKITKSEIPNEYQQVNYLESDGNSYIDTGIIDSSNLKVNIICEIKDVNETAYHCIMASADNLQIQGRYVDNTQTMLKFKFRAVTFGSNSYANPVNIQMGQQTIVNGNVVYKSSYDILGKSNIYLFAKNTANEGHGAAEDFSKSRIYRFSVKYNEEKVLDLIPCYRKSDNTPGMYDTVNKKFFTNNGNGQFILGELIEEDVNLATEKYVDSQIGNINSILATLTTV